MNRRLEGWRLGLAVLVPAVILAAAIWFLLQALSGDDNTALDTSNLVPTSTPVPTSVQESSEVSEPTPVPSPTPLSLPTPLPAPTADPAADAEPTAEPTTAPAPTSAPSTPSQPSQPSQPSGPTATPTPDPNILVVSCTGASFPLSVDVNEALPSLQASVTPPEAASNLQFLWNFGNNTVAGAPNSGLVTYGAEGTYTITLAATDRTTAEVTNVTCGTVTVGSGGSGGGSGGSGALRVTCQVRPVATALAWEDATTTDQMRVTVSWRPTDTILNLQYEFPIPEPIVFSNEASSGDSIVYVFNNKSAVAKIFWRDPATGTTGRTSCRAFPKPATVVTPVPTSYANPGA